MAVKKPNAAANPDIKADDLEYNPAVEPKKAKAWLNLLLESEKVFEKWNDHCDKIDKQYASLERLSNMARDKEFQMFWANCEVLKPSIYAKPPVPVVVPKFKDRRAVPQAASELLERCTVVAFDLTRINDVMMLLRDDVALIGRGVPWCRYEAKKDNVGYYSTEHVCIDYKHRRDFLHSISRCWYEVTWVAAASYLTRGEARKRFHESSGDAYQEADYKVDRDTKEVGGADNASAPSSGRSGTRVSGALSGLLKVAKTSSMRTTRTSSCRISSRAPSRPTAHASATRSSLCPTCCSTRTSSRK